MDVEIATLDSVAPMFRSCRLCAMERAPSVVAVCVPGAGPSMSVTRGKPEVEERWNSGGEVIGGHEQ